VYSPTTRLLTILERLQSRRSVSGPELAAELEVDIRSVRRYIASLRDLGIPIDGEPGRAGTYRLRPGDRLPPVMFTNPEMIAVMLGLAAVRELGLAEACGADSAIDKINRVLPDSLRTQAQAIQGALSFVSRGDRALVSDTILANASLAAYQQRQLWMDYGGTRNEPTQRVVDLYGVTFYGGNWYAVGFCHLRDDFRTFRLDRIIHHRLLETTFDRAPGFNAQEFLRQSLSITPGMWTAVILVDGEEEEIRSRIPPELGQVSADGDHFRWECRVSDLEWMARVLMSVDFPMQVIGPLELQRTLYAMAGRINGMISRAPDALV
jgi:predicted DNA-binding transcriptional regulator YafY